jgi:mono/diheme cytochrome c family protein
MTRSQPKESTMRTTRSTIAAALCAAAFSATLYACSKRAPSDADRAAANIPNSGEQAVAMAQLAQPSAAAPAKLSKEALIKRGQQLVQLGGCHDCHTPMKFDPKLGMPVPQMDLMLSGHPEGGPEPKGAPGVGDQAVIGASFTAFRLPFGTVYSANLTPDPETGLGKVSLEDFKRVVRTGHRHDSPRVLLPPMPWQNLAQQPDAELEAIYAFLQSIRPIKNRVPAPQVPGPVIAEIEKGYQAATAGAARD